MQQEPFVVTSQRTLRARHDWQACDERYLIARPIRASVADCLRLRDVGGELGSAGAGISGAGEM